MNFSSSPKIAETRIEKTVTVSSGSEKFCAKNSVEPVCLYQCIPKDVWKSNICQFLDMPSLGNLRLVCRWFRHEIGCYPVWKQQIPYSHYEEYIQQCQNLGWAPTIHSMKFGYRDYYSFSQISFELLPLSSLEEIDLSQCSQITDPDLNFLPENLPRLILPWDHQLTPVKLETLISEEVDVVFVDLKGYQTSVLYWAVANESLQLAAYCLLEESKSVVDINEANNSGMTPLFIAAQKSYMSIAELLLENGCEVDRPNIEGKTPLMIATEWGNSEIVLLLLKYGADVNKANNRGQTPLIIAKKKKYTKIEQMLQNPQEFLED